MPSSTEESGPTPPLVTSRAVDIIYGTICVVCFLIGTLGNSLSFFYFRSKKRDISRLMYMLITFTDLVISLAALPVGVSLLSQRDPLAFNNPYFCTAWSYTWYLSTKSSIFLVTCLCFSRTYSLLKPFSRQSSRGLAAAVGIFFLLQLVRLVGFHLLEGSRFVYYSPTVRCDMFLDYISHAAYLLLMVGEILTFVIPAIAVITSCALSVMLLVFSNKEGELVVEQRSKNRATVTILLFALVYGICNAPLTAEIILRNYHLHIIKNYGGFLDLYAFDTHFYFNVATITLLLVANSAANPVLYLWRMHRLRKYALSKYRNVKYVGHTEVRPSHNLAELSTVHTVAVGSGRSRPAVPVRCTEGE